MPRPKKRPRTVFRLEDLPDCLIRMIMQHLDIKTLGRVECWSRSWRGWLAPIYFDRYKSEVDKERRRLNHVWEVAEETWAERCRTVYSKFINCGNLIPRFPTPDVRIVTYSPYSPVLEAYVFPLSSWSQDLSDSRDTASGVTDRTMIEQ